jgi:5,10-methylenetetrahydrofolate reductase
MAVSLLEEKLNSKEFVVTAEIGPPKGPDVSEMKKNIELLKGRVDAMNVTDHQSSVMRYPSIGGCLLIKEMGGEPVLQMTTRDRNRIALQAELLFAYSRGIRNVLCLTGDAVEIGDHKEAKPVFDVDSVQLIRMIKTMESGKDFAGNNLNGKVEFFIGASCSPEAHSIKPQLIKFEKKVASGAKFFQTQGIYDVSSLRRFMQFARQFDVKVLAGIIVLFSYRMALYMNENVPGVSVPDEILEELRNTDKTQALKKGAEIAARTIRAIKDENLCDGVHIMAIGREHIIPEVLEASGIQK